MRELSLTGIIECKDESELDATLTKLKCVRNAAIINDGLTIAVDYNPLDTETEFEEEESIARLIDIIESVEIHGFSLMQ